MLQNSKEPQKKFTKKFYILVEAKMFYEKQQQQKKKPNKYIRRSQMYQFWEPCFLGRLTTLTPFYLQS